MVVFQNASVITGYKWLESLQFWDAENSSMKLEYRWRCCTCLTCEAPIIWVTDNPTFYDSEGTEGLLVQLALQLCSEFSNLGFFVGRMYIEVWEVWKHLFDTNHLRGVNIEWTEMIQLPNAMLMLRHSQSCFEASTSALSAEKTWIERRSSAL